MKLCDLVVVTDSSRASDDRLELAASLAAEHDACLVGIYVLPIPEPEQSEKPRVIDQIIMNCIREEQKQALAVHRKFESALARHGIKGEWRTPGGIAWEETAIQARYADMVIVGQVNPALKGAVISPLCPEDVALSAGRPVLVAPLSWAPTRIGHRILVAWNARREATRAVHDALPLLIKAELVTVLVANPETWVVPPHGQEPGADIALHLARHGIKVQVDVVVAQGTRTGEIVRAKARETGADLIVMGAYGHSRTRELVLGGVTRYMLREMPVPVLLSH
jgi:nucleotide-binding universal stress UspA family protein